NNNATRKKQHLIDSFIPSHFKIRIDEQRKNDRFFMSSKTLQQVFTWAQRNDYTHVMVDVVTLNQSAMDAQAVLVLTHAYRSYPVLVAVANENERIEYQNRFWCAVEMMEYSRNPSVFSLTEDHPTWARKQKFNTLQDIIKSTDVTATYQLDRIKVMLME